MRLARQGAPHGSLIFAERQLRGRGRWNRVWESPPGGLYLSIVLRPDPRSPLGILPLVAAVAAAEALKEKAAVDCDLKWPNDLLAAGRKIGGVLCESSFSGSRCEFAVVGIGVNVAAIPSVVESGRGSGPISVREISSREIDSPHLGVEIALALEKWWEREGPERALEAWKARARGLEGAAIRVRSQEGGSYQATTSGLADDGGLRVRLGDGTERVLRSDDVHLGDP